VIDLAPVRQRVAAAREALAAAEADIANARTALQAAVDRQVEAVRSLEVASELETTILRFAVPDSNGHRPEPEVAAVGSLRNKGTREAVVEFLASYPSQPYPLDEMVDAMKTLGFTGSHNAVHVLLSRGLKDGSIPVQRVRQGVYQYAPRSQSAAGDGLFPGDEEAHGEVDTE
jgi:hypothetical protein